MESTLLLDDQRMQFGDILIVDDVGPITLSEDAPEAMLNGVRAGTAKTWKVCSQVLRPKVNLPRL